jgi:hypothetical protein
MSTGQKMAGGSATMRPPAFLQSGGPLVESPGWLTKTPVVFLDLAPTLEWVETNESVYQPGTVRQLPRRDKPMVTAPQKPLGYNLTHLDTSI